MKNFGMSMKNFVQPGEWGLTVIAPTGGVVSGQVVIVGSIIGIASTTQPAGAEVEIRCEGVYDLSKVRRTPWLRATSPRWMPPGRWPWRAPRPSAG
jgi:predicted RecA/RadA family phage recombinase